MALHQTWKHACKNPQLRHREVRFFKENKTLMAIQLKISGFVDYTERENRLFSDWKEKVKEVYSLFGFMEFHPRPIESIEALQSKGGIAHQIYTLGRLQDQTMTDLGLPFDRTIPLAIYIAAHRHELVYPFKRFDISHSFRGERAQAGRFRGFIQADIDVVSENLSPLSEIECLSALVCALQKLKVPPFTVYLNHLSIPQMLMEEMGFTQALIPDALRIVDKMDKIGLEKVAKELYTLLPSADLTQIGLLSFRGSLEEFLKDAPKNIAHSPGFLALTELFHRLRECFADPSLFGFCPGMVRGLDYYTGIVAETFLQNYPGIGSIASGGRYNKLIDHIIEKETKLEGFGISIGLTRLFDSMKKENLFPLHSPPPVQILVAYLEESLQQEALLAANTLRREGFHVDLFCGKGSIGKQISYASKKEIPFTFMLMGKSFVIKNLETGVQTEDISSLELAIQTVKKLLLE
jgi:histidyl-tRNA synthetase